VVERAHSTLHDVYARCLHCTLRCIHARRLRRGEHVGTQNFMPRVWPRASVLAERLWSSAAVNDTATAMPRLHEVSELPPATGRQVSRGAVFI
jgi:hypothetical protein